MIPDLSEELSRKTQKRSTNQKEDISENHKNFLKLDIDAHAERFIQSIISIEPKNPVLAG